MNANHIGQAPGVVTPAESSDPSPELKRLETLIVELALAGHQVNRLEEGYLVCRWGMTKVLPDCASLVKFARQIGGQQ